MQYPRDFSFAVLLLALLAAAPVRSVPDIDTCQAQRKELQTSAFSIVLQEGDLEDWADEQKESICVKQQGNKVTCNLDYVNATESSAWCLDVPNTVYLETTFIVKCENDNKQDDKRHVFYSVRNRPACYSTSCYDGYDTSILETLERASFDDLINEMKNPNTDSEWGKNMGAFEVCTVMRLALTDPIISEAVAVVTTASPTISPAPTVSSAPTNSPTNSPAPTISPAPTVTPKELTCKEESASLMAEGNNISTLGGDNESALSGVAFGLSSTQALIDIDIETGKGFEAHCNKVDGDSLCEFDYADALAMTTEEGNSIPELCQNAYGVYVEDSVSITCTSEETSAKTRLVFKNKPTCRSRLCNVDEIREVAATEFDRWMKLSLEEGLQEASLGSGEAILNGPHSCVIDVEKGQTMDEGVDVAVGGPILANLGGDPILPTDECQVFTNAVDGNINIYNEKALFQKEILAYVSADLRQICASPTPGEMDCNFDWSEIMEPEDIPSETTTRQADAKAFRNLCMPDGIGDSGAGQYVESTFKITCSNLSGNKIVVTNTNVPGCAGRPCTPGQTQYLFADDYTYLADKFIKQGWDCSTEILSVYAPYYNPFFGTYEMTDIASNVQFPPVVDTPEETPEGVPENVGSNPLVDGGNFNVINVDPSTPAPSSNLHLRGPQYGNLFKTDAPLPVEEEVVEDTSSSSKTFFGTTTILLLIPAALSMLLS